jgi:hypothetical protein
MDPDRARELLEQERHRIQPCSMNVPSRQLGGGTCRRTPISPPFVAGPLKASSLRSRATGEVGSSVG